MKKKMGRTLVNNDQVKRIQHNPGPARAYLPPRRAPKPKPTSTKVDIRAEHSAGGVVFRRVGRQVLIGYIKDTYGKWTFPKGHLEKGETPAAAALRETHEEMGLKQLRVLAPLGSISIRFKDRYTHVGQVIQKRIDFFLMETSPEEIGVPQGSEGIHVIRWVSARQALRLAGYKNIQPIVKKAVNLLEQVKL